MDHPCYRCNQDVPESNAFCPHCGAPQIRVPLPENPEQQTQSPYEAPHLPSELPSTPPALSQRDFAVAAPVRWPLAWKGALLCGLGAAVLSSIPIVSSGCCLWMLGAGALSVSLYRKQIGGAQVTPGIGMRVGALAGVFGFVLNAFVAVGSFMALRSSGNFSKAMQEQMQKQMATTPDPKVQEMMRQMIEWMNTSQGAVVIMALFLAILAAVFVVFTAAGGALGASMFGRSRDLR